MHAPSYLARRLGGALVLVALAATATACSGEKKPKAPAADTDASVDPAAADDSDGDGVANGDDNCPDDANANQKDADNDSVGDACDNCARVANVDQADDNADGIGDACKNATEDGDGDGVPDVYDNCPSKANPSQDDRDKDGFGDACDDCPSIADIDQADANGDGIGDACDDFTNSDGDPIPDYLDNCPTVTNADQADGDGDGVGDVCDDCPKVADPGQEDFDKDGVGDYCDPDLADPAVCAKGAVPASANKPNLYFLIDRSTSMGLSSGIPTRLDFVKIALGGLAGSAQAPGPIMTNFNVGVGAFPAASGSCSVADLPERVLPIADRPAVDAYNVFTTAYGGVEVSGHTPTHLALSQVRTQQLYDFPGDPVPNRPKAVVLITDGLPNDCVNLDAPNHIDETVAEAGALAALGVPVFALGFPGVGADTMQRIANAGDPAPGDNPWFPVFDDASITAALAQIIKRTAGCTLVLDPTGNGTPNPDILSVDLVENSGAKRTPIAEDPVNGYSIAGQTLTLHGSSCDTLQTAVTTDATARVEAKMGCACVPAAVEMCGDHLDNTCNGHADETCVPTEICGENAPIPHCPPADECKPEVCDGVDNDCDDLLDEGCPGEAPPNPADPLR